MNKRMIRKKVKTLCAVLLTAVALSALKPVASFAAYSYQNANKYTAGDAEIKKPVKNLDVDWISGKVSIEYHRGSTVELRESSKKKLSDDMRLRWWLDGDTLRVRFAKPGLRQLTIRDKELTITLPEDSAFGKVSIAAVSGDLFVPSLQTDSLKLDVISGDIKASAEAKTVAVETTSGDLDLHLNGKTKDVKIDTISGTVEVELETADRFTAESVSGEIGVKAKSIGEFEASAGSGDISAEIGKMKRAAISTTSGEVKVGTERFDALTISSTSGDVRADLPEKPGFTAKLKVTSGEIGYDLPLKKEGKTFVCGDGSGELSISTTSGDITLK